MQNLNEILKTLMDWIYVKYLLNSKQNHATVRDRQIYWCSLGYNVGHEENGKGNKYRRPVLVFKKFNDRLFWGIPMTTKVKDNKYYIKVKVGELEECAMISQMRIMDANRIIEPMERILPEEFEKVKIAIQELVK
jgi:mRNA-degrading endonuclease toxin of MazEF toxin-antitoxin module